jgi:hypothetical protein
LTVNGRRKSLMLIFVTLNSRVDPVASAMPSGLLGLGENDA